MNYYALEVYAFDVQFYSPTQHLEGGLYTNPSAHPRLPYALAFQFLDYPLLLTYASQGPRDLQLNSWSGQPPLYVFESGKSCVLQAEPAELEFLLEKVRFVTLDLCGLQG